ncbi:MAG: saccharopine dehydrogenase C-terminal domain-containing protein [Saprospiraceae bacterium]|nr:saccharopine dehydrogenase C-terminal domain-containing protein [Saprospiraceae bacterium]
MKSILILGAGRSSTTLINYLIKAAEEHGWMVTVADTDLDIALSKTEHSKNALGVQLDVNDVAKRQDLIRDKNVVVSLLPAFLHPIVAKDCLEFSKHLVTASYLNEDIRSMEQEALAKGLLFMGEMGLDPGIDHMSAMQKINEIKAEGATLSAFYSNTGGLIAPESDDNPWSYKFTWNPRNVVLAGQGTAQYLNAGKIKYIPYNRLFSERKVIQVPELGPYDVYANRDSLPYRKLYGIENVPTILRGTIRANGYCDAWDTLVKIGLTDDSYGLDLESIKTYRELVESFILGTYPDIKTGVSNFLGLPLDHEIIRKLEWTELFSDRPIKLKRATPAQALEDLLLDKWALKKEDKDMIIMQHQFEYVLDGESKKLISSMVTKGEDSVNTSMAKTVGLPVAILVKLLLLGKVSLTGVHIPVMAEIYEPVLEELKKYGIDFIDEYTS